MCIFILVLGNICLFWKVIFMFRMCDLFLYLYFRDLGFMSGIIVFFVYKFCEIRVYYLIKKDSVKVE